MAKQKTTNWDALVASSPLDKKAAVDASAKGVAGFAHFTVEDTKLRRFAPPKTVKATTGIELAGLKCGKLTVIGLSAEKKPGRRPAAWIVRCVCGMYEARTARALRDPEYAKRAKCDECDYRDGVVSGKIPPRFTLKFVPVGGI